VLNCGGTTKNAVGILPSAKGKQQKFVVGDHQGNIGCYQIKKMSAEVVFKQPAVTKQGVTALAIGGPKAEPDRVFAAFGQTVQGIKKKVCLLSSLV
jgi:hypothetical protein